jgi:lysozyme family protein
MSVYDSAFDYLIGNEGSTFSNDPNDSGGPTKFGVTLREYAHFTQKSITVSDMENLTREEAKEFFLWAFWKPISGDEIKSPVIATCLFDSAVLYGQSTAVIMAQKVIKDLCQVPLKLDGIVGDMTLGLLNSLKPASFISQYHGYISQRIDSVIANFPNDQVFKKGWMNRADRLLTLIES